MEVTGSIEDSLNEQRIRKILTDHKRQTDVERDSRKQKRSATYSTLYLVPSTSIHKRFLSSIEFQVQVLSDKEEIQPPQAAEKVIDDNPPPIYLASV
ncbi:unnamed protein product [Nezara viridula]|uniref:Uncharacterized protein n=1 Tax=Nezara viridula TaxID=85310 RepID=A0A9P0E4G3_NEZVI|nr:unnamed protein product [Nezara viridula]